MDAENVRAESRLPERNPHSKIASSSAASGLRCGEVSLTSGTTKMQAFHRFLLLGFLGLMAANASGQDHWPRFRGAEGTGVAADHENLPERWTATDNVAWSTEIPGLGWSCPIVWGDRVFLTSVVADESNVQPKKGLYLGRGVRKPAKGVHHWMVHCFDLKSGDEVWTHEAHVGTPKVPRHPKSTYASETATTDGERLYVMFGDLGLFCYDLEGTRFGVTKSCRGRRSSTMARQLRRRA